MSTQFYTTNQQTPYEQRHRCRTALGWHVVAGGHAAEGLYRHPAQPGGRAGGRDISVERLDRRLPRRRHAVDLGAPR